MPAANPANPASSANSAVSTSIGASAAGAPITRRAFTRSAALGVAAALTALGGSALGGPVPGGPTALGGPAVPGGPTALGGLLAPTRALADGAYGQYGQTDQVVQVRESNGTRLMTPYYSLLLPDGLIPQGCSYSYDPALYDLATGSAGSAGSGSAGSSGAASTGLLWGFKLDIDLYDGTGFFVLCHSLNWTGVQGAYATQDVGISGSDATLMVAVASGTGAASGDFSQARGIVQTFAQYVSPDITSAAAPTGMLTSSGVTSSTSTNDDYTYLCLLHDRLGAYDDQVRAMATTFNNDFLNADLNIGRGELIANSTLQSTLRTEYRNLLTRQIGTGSWLYTYATEMLVLINDLQERLVPIYQAWQVRMCYPVDARDHRDVIVAPLAQDLYPSGLSIFKADFSERYDRANPR